MKKFKIVLIFALIVLLIFAVAGCKKSSGKSIGVPSDLFVENEVLTWSPVKGAIEYEVMVDDETFTAEEESFPLSIYDYEDHTISVRAITLDGTGAFSTAITYARTPSSELLPQLSAPYGISMTSNRLMWNAVLNNNGYKIFFDGKSITVPKNATYYDLTFKGDGTYYIQMQTLGDGVTYASSKVSASYAVTVKDGKAPLKKLTPVELSFDKQQRAIVWTNRYTAAAASYEVYRDTESLPVATLPAEDGKIQMSYVPELNGGKTSYRVRLISNNGLYNPSDFSEDITFPLADAAPDGLAIVPNEGFSAFTLTWNARDFKEAYIVEIDGSNYVRTIYESYTIPLSTAVGEHKVRVRTDGDGIYYAASTYSAELSFYAHKTGVVYMPLAMPQDFNASYDTEEETFFARFAAVQYADRYKVTIAYGEQKVEFEIKDPSLMITETTLQGKAIEEADQEKVALALSLVQTGAFVSVQALPEVALFEKSPVTREIFVTGKDLIQVYDATPVSFGASGLTWNAIPGALGYYLVLDGEKIELTQNSYAEAIAEGLHSVRVYAKVESGETPVSEELLFRAPKRADVPTNLKITSGILTFTPSANAMFYELYSNGQLVTSLNASETAVMLSTFIKTDGTYKITLKSKTYSNYLIESVFSEEVVYVKTDGDFGTEIKPYVPANAAELGSLLALHPDAYFRLASGVYDFAGVRLDPLSTVNFTGKLNGNGATLKNLSLSAPLFATIREAMIENITIEIAANGFVFEQNGVLAKEIEKTEFTNVNLKLSGTASVGSGSSFGIVAFDVGDWTITGGGLTFVDCSITGSNLSLGILASAAEAELEGFSISGVLALTGDAVSFNAVFAQGEVELKECEVSLGVTINARESVFCAGASFGGKVKAQNCSFHPSFVVNGESLTYVGISSDGAVLKDCSIGGGLQANVLSADVFGLSKEGSFEADGVSVTSQLSVTAPSRAVVAGITQRLTDGHWTNSTSAAALVVHSDSAEVGGVSIYDEIGLSGTFNVSISVEGDGSGTAEVGGVSTYGAGGNVTLFGTISVKNVGTAEIGGIGVTNSEKVKATGSLTVRTEGCGVLRVGGILCRGDGEIDARDLAITLALEAETAYVGGLMATASAANVLISNLRVNGSVEADSVYFGGAFSSVGTLTKRESSSISVQTAVTGEGTACGFAADMQKCSISDLTLSGLLTTDTCNAYGVAPILVSLRGVSSSLSFAATDPEKVVAIAGKATTVQNIFYHDASVTVASFEALVIGGVETYQTGAVTGEMRAVSFIFNPYSEEMGGTIELFGLTNTASQIEGASIQNCSVKVGKLTRFVFGGIARSVSTGALNSSVSYSIETEAEENEIGGAFYHLGGAITNLSVGTKNAPMALTVKGEGSFGGVAYESGDATLGGGGVYVRANVTTAQGNTSLIGGVVCSLPSERTLTAEQMPNELTLTASGDGDLIAGGAAAETLGTLRGWAPVISVEGASATFGGVSGSLRGGEITLCRADGSARINGKAGGIVGSAENGTIRKCYSGLSIDLTEGSAGGVFAEGEHLNLFDSYSTVSFAHKGAGLFYTATDVSLSTVYYAGYATEFAIASRVSSGQSHGILIDASLNNLTALESGTLDYAYETLSYGYAGADFNGDWTVERSGYPYIEALGAIVAPARETSVLSALNITADLDLYSVLPRFVQGVIAPSVAWVDGGDILKITCGEAEITDNGEAVLYGYLSGGVKAFEVPYTVTGYGALEGEGTSESPYLIKQARYFKNIKGYLAANPTAHFKWDTEEDEINDFEFPSLFDTTSPFRGTIDFSGVTFSSPSIPENGIFASIDGGTVKNLTLSQATGSGAVLAATIKDATISNVTLSGSCSGTRSLIGTSQNSTLTNLTGKITIEEEASFALVRTLSGGTLEDVSLYVSVYAWDNVTAYLVETASNAAVEKAQFYLNGSRQNRARYALVNETTASAFDKILSVLYVPSDSADTASLAGFAFASDGGTLSNAAILCLVEAEYTASALAASGTCTYQNVKVLVSSDYEVTVPSVAGVTEYSVGTIAAAIASITGFAEGDLYTPVGIDRFAIREIGSFSVLSKEEQETPELLAFDDVVSVRLTDSLLITSSDPLSRVVAYSYEGANASVIGNDLVFTASGNGTLVVTNLFGAETRIPVQLSSFGGFALGDGTQADPYVIESFADLKKATRYEDAYFVLNQDVSGTLSSPIAFNGHLSGTGSITVTLSETNLFNLLHGEIDGINFTIAAGEYALSGTCGLFANTGSDVTLRNMTINFGQTTVTLTEESAFGLLFGRANDDVTLQNVTVVCSSLTVTTGANECVIGAAIGKAVDATFDTVTINATMTVTAGGNATIGAIGTLTTYEENTLFDGGSIILDLNATGSDLTVGGLAGALSANAKDLTVSAFLTLAGNLVQAGGICGTQSYELTDVTVNGTISVQGDSVFVGGIAGVSNGTVTNVTATASVSGTSSGYVYAGGAIGQLNGSISKVKVTASSVSAISTAVQEVLETATSAATYIDLLSAAGGVVGLSGGSITSVQANVPSVTASSEVQSETLYIAAGGIAVAASSLSDVEVKGTGAISASGGHSVAGGLCAVLFDTAERAIIGAVTLSADLVGGAVAEFSFVEASMIQNVYSLAAVGAEQAGLVGSISLSDHTEEVNTGVVTACYYLNGVDVFVRENLDYVTSNTKLAAASDFNGSAIYASFDSEVWTLQEGHLPTLKE